MKGPASEEAALAVRASPEVVEVPPAAPAALAPDSPVPVTPAAPAARRPGPSTSPRASST